MAIRVSEIIKDHDDLITVKDDVSIFDALSIMITNDFSQLPIVDKNGNLLGLITQEKIIKEYYLTGGDIKFLNLAVNHVLVSAKKLDKEADIEDLTALLKDVYAVVIINDETLKPESIVTNYDIAQFFWSFTKDLLDARRIETGLRDNISKIYNEDDERINKAVINSHPSKEDKNKSYKTFEKFSFNDYIRLISNEENWHDFNEIYRPKELFIHHMESARDIRNQVAHLEDELSVLDKEKLASARRWFDSRPTVGDYKDESPSSGEIIKASQPAYLKGGSKYAPLGNYLLQKRLEGERGIRLDFSEIESLLREDLPESAYQHRAFWGNHHGSPRAVEWMSAGWLVDKVDSETKEVLFRVSRTAYYPLVFSTLLEGLKKNEPNIFLSNTKISNNNWLSLSTGKSGFSFAWVLPKDPQLRIELYINTGDTEKNKNAFDFLKAKESIISNSITSELVWDKLEDKKVSRIYTEHPFDPFSFRDDFEDIEDWAINTMIEFIATFKPLILDIDI